MDREDGIKRKQSLVRKYKPSSKYTSKFWKFFVLLRTSIILSREKITIGKRSIANAPFRTFEVSFFSTLFT